jgi:hypothetical protein
LHFDPAGIDTQGVPPKSPQLVESLVGVVLEGKQQRTVGKYGDPPCSHRHDSLVRVAD